LIFNGSLLINLRQNQRVKERPKNLKLIARARARLLMLMNLMMECLYNSTNYRKCQLNGKKMLIFRDLEIL